MERLTTGSRIVQLIKPIRSSHSGLAVRERQRGEQCAVLRELSDGLGRKMFRVIFDDGDERVVLDSDVEVVEVERCDGKSDGTGSYCSEHLCYHDGGDGTD